MQKLRRWSCAVCLSLLVFEVAVAQEDEPAGMFLYGSGNIQVVRSLQTVSIEPGMDLFQDDSLRADIGGQMKVRLDDDSVLMLWEDTEIRIKQMRMLPRDGVRDVEIEHLSGNLRVIAAEFVGKESRVLVQTPSAKIALHEQADVLITHEPEQDLTEVVALEGTPEVAHLFTDFAGSVTLEPAQTTLVTLDDAPSDPVFVSQEALAEQTMELQWLMPEPIPDWETFFGERLLGYGESAYGEVRRRAARPLLPVRTTVEGLVEEAPPTPPVGNEPRPTGTLDVDFEIVDEAQ